MTQNRTQTWKSPTLSPLLNSASPERPLIHRDLSWLQFNARVLTEANDASNPLLERAKFLSISSSNLDEFFMIRFASLERSLNALRRHGKLQRAQQLAQIRSLIFQQVRNLTAKQGDTLLGLAKELKAQRVYLVTEAKTKGALFELGKQIFSDKILETVTQPEIFNTRLMAQMGSMEAIALFPGGRFVSIPKSTAATYFKTTETGEIYIFFLDHLLMSHLGAALRLEGAPVIFRLTRDGDFSVDVEEEDPESIPDAIKTGIGTREKGKPVRLQYSGKPSPNILSTATSVLKLSESQVFSSPKTLALHGLWSIVDRIHKEAPDRAQLFYSDFHPTVPKTFNLGPEIFKLIQKQDFLLHHPYDSFDCFVAWIQCACTDPAVTMIEQTVYRMDTLSPVIEALKAAAKKKRVRVVIELRARFDELNNLKLADELRTAGVEVAFGLPGLKVHAKLALVTRTEDSGPVLYTHLSTGNYNAKTARQYTDLAILTANQEIGQDVRLFFDSVWRGEVPEGFTKLLSAPTRLHRRMIQHIRAEIKAANAGKPARIIAKVNALVDEAIIEYLYHASRAGVKVDLIVRGACSLVPGIKGLSENIRVIGIVDRFLEHSRIYYFESSSAMYLSSADWMPRNFFSRLEIAFPVLDQRIYRFLLDDVIPAYLRDTVKARQLTAKGQWKKREIPQGEAPFRCQTYFQELAHQEYAGTPLDFENLNND